MLALIVGVVSLVAGLAVGYVIGSTDRAIADSRAFLDEHRRRHPVTATEESRDAN